MITNTTIKSHNWFFSLIVAAMILFAFPSTGMSTVIYSDNFDADVNLTVPVGWTATANASCGGGCQSNWWNAYNAVNNITNRSAMIIIYQAATANSVGYANRVTDNILYHSVNATAYTSITLDFKWKCTGNAADYGKVCYSTNGGVSWTNLAATYNLQGTTQTVTGLALPAALNNTTFLIGMRFICDGATSNQQPFVFDDFVVNGTGSGCPFCSDGIMNCSETGVDCGGPDCVACGCVATGNNFCSGAVAQTLNGTCCAGTLSGATDDWAGTIGCQSGNHPEVWFSGTPSAGQTQLSFLINNLGAGFGGNVELVVVSSTSACGGLTLVGSFCGASPVNYNLIVTPGTTYYWTVSSGSGSNGATSTFSICVTQSVYVDNSACNIGDIMTAVPAPTVNATYPAGTYPPATTVQFNYTITGWDIGASCNWLAGIVPSWGSGWDPASFVRTLNPVPAAGDIGDTWGWWTKNPMIHNVSGANINPNSGAWIYCNNKPNGVCTGINTNVDWGDGCIADNWGHFGCNAGCDAVGYAALTWNVGFRLTTRATAALCAVAASDLSVNVKTYADGEIGSWTSIGCMADIAATNGFVQACCIDALSPMTWSGATTSWANTDNWGSCILPTCTNDIVIASTASNPTMAVSGNCRNITINAGATLTINAGVTLSICGNFINNGTIVCAAGSTVSFIGTAAQSISGSTTSTFSNLIVNNTSATGLTLSTPANVAGALTLTDGNVYTTATNVLTLNDNATSTSGSAASFVDGPMKKIGNDAFVFPVGDNTIWARLAITAPGVVTDAFTTQYIDAAYGTLTPVIAPNFYVSSIEHWICNRTTGTSNVSVTLYWESGGRSGINTFTSDLHVARWDGTAWQDHGSGTMTGSAALGTIQTSGAVTSFSPFTFASISATLATNPLPVELLTFNAIYNGQSVDVTWNTATEINNSYFNVERSIDAQNFVSITQVPSKAIGGNSTSLLSYSFNDADVKEGVYYYRLKQTDFGGNIKYSAIAPVTIDAQNSIFMVRPNPTANTADIIYHCSGSENANIKVYDARGRLVISKTINCIKGENVTNIDLREQPDGLFYITLTTGNNVFKSKLLKTK